MIKTQAKHIIHKLSVDFNSSDHQDSLGLKDQSMNFVKEIVLPALEEVLEELEDERVIRIDQLKLELNQIDAKHFKEDLRRQIISQFPKTLQTEIDQSAIEIKAQHSPLEAFDYFLQTGALPWWDTANSIQKIENAVLDLITNQEDAREKIKAIMLTANADRFAQQLSKDFVKAVFKLIRVPSEIWSLISDAQILLKDHFSPRLIRNKFIKNTILLFQHKNTESLTTQKVAYLVFEQLEPTLIKRTGKNLKSLFIRSNELLQNTAYTLMNEYTNKEPSKTPEKIFKKSINTAQHAESYYIKNAGLVLLHPFLTYLFEELEYTKGKSFVDEFQQQQAALALQYTLDPKDQFAEYELPLNKILCNINLGTPIESKLVQSEMLSLKTEQLLLSTIQHWPALKNTSIDGLRQTFLNREGKLSKKENGDWKLFVEYKAYDVLLSSLGWNYSLIKLPWMTNILWVEWG